MLVMTLNIWETTGGPRDARILFTSIHLMQAPFNRIFLILLLFYNHTFNTYKKLQYGGKFLSIHPSKSVL